MKKASELLQKPNHLFYYSLNEKIHDEGFAYGKYLILFSGTASITDA